MIWLLESTKPFPLLGKSYWLKRGAWPRPMGWFSRTPQAFHTKAEAEEWLFQNHIRKGRDVSFVKPVRVHINTLKKEGFIYNARSNNTSTRHSNSTPKREKTSPKNRGFSSLSW